MRVKTVKSTKGSISYSIIRDITKPDGKRSTEIVQNLGNRVFDSFISQKVLLSLL